METRKLAVLIFSLALLLSTASAAKDYAMGKVTSTSPSGGDTTTPGGGDTGAGGGGGGGGAATTVTVLEKTLVGTLSEAELTAILAEAGFTEEQIAAAKVLAGKAEVTQTIKVEKITSATGSITYKTTVTITITNPSNMDWKDVKVIVEIPKSIAASASEVTSPLSFTTLKQDPVIQFVVDISNGTSKTITWSVAKYVSSSNADTIKGPGIASFTEVAPPTDNCLGVNCDDSNPCTIDSCTAATGDCLHTIVANNTVCGTGMVCTAGACVIKPTGVVTQPPLLPTWAILLIVIIIIAAAYYFLVVAKKTKKK